VKSTTAGQRHVDICRRRGANRGTPDYPEEDAHESSRLNFRSQSSIYIVPDSNRRWRSASVVSSTRDAIVQTWPDGSMIHAVRSPQY
jgi:hypothetical protein